MTEVIKSTKESRKCWKEEEDMRLLKLYKIYGEQWKKISEILHSSESYNSKLRTAASCRERYQYILKPNLNKKEWSKEEEKKLFQLLQQFGNCWSKITMKMRNRSELICKNYFYATLRRVLRRIAKQAGIQKPSQLFKSIKPNVPQRGQLVIAENCRQQLRHLILQYQYIQKEEILQLNIDEKQNIQKLLQTLVMANENYVMQKQRSSLNQIFQHQPQEQSPCISDKIIKKINTGQNVFKMVSKQVRIEPQKESCSNNNKLQIYGKTISNNLNLQTECNLNFSKVEEQQTIIPTFALLQPQTMLKPSQPCFSYFYQYQPQCQAFHYPPNIYQSYQRQFQPYFSYMF